jgi:endonuclease/exonuclease/phosphatase family metal-dependent hydrolase
VSDSGREEQPRVRSRSSRAASDLNDVRFKLGTWNCFGMARKALDAITGIRAPAPRRLQHDHVVTSCAAPEIFCVQELFSRDAEDFFDRVCKNPAPHRNFAFVRDHNRLHFRTATVRGTGLGIRSLGALQESRYHHFNQSTGWDRLARKGLLHARVALSPQIEMDVVTVHLQAGEDRTAALVRQAQLVDVAEFVRSVSSRERACIVCGDFNICGLRSEREGPEYARLTAALPGFVDLGATDDHATFDPAPHANSLAFAFEPEGRRQRLDYIFLRPPGSAGYSIECNGVSLFLHEPLAALPLSSRSNAFASDHFGLVATFECSAQALAMS